MADEVWRNTSGVTQRVALSPGYGGNAMDVFPGKCVILPKNPNPKTFKLQSDFMLERKKTMVPGSIMNPMTRPANQKDLVSVIIPTFNCMDYLPKCIDSILGQEYKNIEIIIVDDGSTDGTREWVASQTKNIGKFLTYSKNRGSNYARNVGYKISRGEFVLFCDADLVMNRAMIGSMKQALDINKNVSYAYCKFNWINTESNFTKVVGGGDWNINELYQHNYISMMSLLRRPDFIPFDLKLKRYQDYDLWLGLAKQGKRGIFVNAILFNAYMRPDGITKTESENEALTYIRKKYNIVR